MVYTCIIVIKLNSRLLYYINTFSVKIESLQTSDPKVNDCTCIRACTRDLSMYTLSGAIIIIKSVLPPDMIIIPIRNCLSIH